MKILIINGPNLNMLGIREPELYGNKTYWDLCEYIERCASKSDVIASVYQSNHEGDIVDKIQSARGEFDGIIINAAAYTHTSIAILDALKSSALPAVEVHLTNINEREEFRRNSYISLACEKQFIGYGFEGYNMAIEFLADKYK